MAHTVVHRAEGTWHVDIDVLCDDGVVHHRVGSYYTRRRAEIAASLIERAANRELGRTPL